jgi:hypothetical protein
MLIQMRRERASKRSGSVLTAARRAGFKILPSTWRAVKRVVAAAHNAASFRELLTGKFADLPQNVKNTICGVVKTVVRGRWAGGWLLLLCIYLFSVNLSLSPQVPDSTPGATMYREAVVAKYISDQYYEKMRGTQPAKVLRRRKTAHAYHKNLVRLGVVGLVGWYCS